MPEELVAGGVDGGDGRVGLEAAGGELVGEVFACVEVFEHGGDGDEVFIGEGDGGVGGCDGGGEIRRLDQESLMGCEGGGFRGAAD